MASNYSTKFILDCCEKYGQQEVKKIQQQSGYQLVLTDDKIYDLDEIILLRRRDVGNMPSTIHVVEKEDDDYADMMLVFLAIDHLLFNTDRDITFDTGVTDYVYEQTAQYRLSRPVVGINNIVTYVPYDSITEVPQYVLIIKNVLDPDLNYDFVQYLYGQIPAQIREKDGFIQINTNSDDNFFDVLDIFDPDDVL